MTTAEQLEKRGALKSKIEVAINLLKEGLDYDFIVEVTKLELSKIKELEAELATELATDLKQSQSLQTNN